VFKQLFNWHEWIFFLKGGNACGNVFSVRWQHWMKGHGFSWGWAGVVKH
jgi:hypothetical protein